MKVTRIGRYAAPCLLAENINGREGRERELENEAIIGETTLYVKPMSDVTATNMYICECAGFIR